MTTDNKTLADAQPGGRVRLGDQLPPLPEPKVIGAGRHPPVKLHYGYSAEQMREYARAALSAQPSPGGQDQVGVDDLAQVIRQVDGQHSLGAGALAEAILAKLSQLAARQPVGEPVAWVPAKFLDKCTVAMTARRAPPSAMAVELHGEYVPLYASPTGAAK